MEKIQFTALITIDYDSLGVDYEEAVGRTIRQIADQATKGNTGVELAIWNKIGDKAGEVKLV